MYEHLNETDWRVFYFIKEWNEEHAYNPSIRDIMLGIGKASTSHIAYVVGKLESAGLVIREEHIARSLRVVPESVERQP